MTSIEEFKCVFCQESFSNKEDLQIHFRKHANPTFNTKSKSRQSQPPNEEKQSDELDMVSCDVCTEMFPTISKAITHKHKVHPDHDAKYFCPWCGKLFTMKHLYNKHMQSTHGDMERNDNLNFHCDMCNVDFYLATAMLYHNKFFHRQDTDLPIIGQSKKLKMVNQELLQIYYCAFCGDEYDNKVNIHKHMTEEHIDENQSPEEILRCPLCEAIFYHLDAYEVHLTFHSTEDLYSEKNDMFEQITDFSLESVSPIIEKVQDAEDAETALSAVGIEKFLEMAMDNSLDNDNDLPKKSKKRKKHKKSKKSAITLDEFLNMNKDVFGEGIDIQGVEEVPTQMVAKKLNPRKVGRPPKKSNITDLEKLKKQGIEVKMKTTKKVPVQAMKIKGLLGETAINVPKGFTNNHTTETKTENDIISKLMNQSNSQIKIVKKSSKDNSNIDQQLKDHTSQSSLKSPQYIVNNSDVTASNHTSSETENIYVFQNSKAISPIQEQKMVELNSKNDNQQVEQLQLSDKKSVLESDSAVEVVSNKLKNDTTIISKVNDINAHNSTHLHEENSMSAEYDSERSNHAQNTDEELPAQEPNDNEISTQESHNVENDSKNNSLAVLKHLSHLITIKPVSPKSSVPLEPIKSNEHKIVEVLQHPESSRKNITKTVSPPPSKEEPNKGLKSLNKNITVKSLVELSSVNDEHSSSDEVTNQNLLGKKPVVIQSHNPKNELSILNSEKEESQNTNDNILKRLTNITAKPINTIKNYQQDLTNNRQNIQCRKAVPNKITESPINENIEIFNIDDSDSDGADNISVPSKISSTQGKTMPNEPLKKLQSINKNITIKSMNKETMIVNKNNSHSKQIVNKSEVSMSNFSEGENHNKIMSISNMSSQAKIQNTLKNLSKAITVKSGNLSPIMPMNVNKNVFSQNVHSYEDSDDDSIPCDVNITELNDGNLSGEEFSEIIDKNNEYESNVQSPEESYGEDDDNCNDDVDGELSDLEEQLKVNTLKIPIQMAPLGNIKQINKNITVKKVANEQTPANMIERKCNVLPNHKEISIKPFKQVKSEAIEQPSVSKKPELVQTHSQSINHCENSNSQMGSTVNKEVTVKTFQTQTVIQEITTTVTKTIKTVNQAVKQQLQTINSQPLKFQKVQGMSSNNCVQPVTVRQRAPTTGMKVRGMMSTRPPQGNTVRPCNQLVSIRQAMSNTIRTAGPRMPSVKNTVPSTSNPQTIIEGKPLKVSTSAVVAKRTSEERVGHFSCFKKPKESLIPISDIPIMDDDNSYNSSNNYMASQSTSNFSSVTKTIKGNTIINSTQMKSEATCSSQQLSKLTNISGLKIVKTSKQSVQVEEKCELSPSKRNTLEAIEKLQKQGLLIKKPRIESPNENYHYEEDD